MKKNLLLFVLLLFSLASYSQIQTQFFGLTLGKSTRYNVINTMKAKGYKLSYEDGSILINNGLNSKKKSFAGYSDWSCLFQFHNNLLMQVSFSEVSFFEKSIEDKIASLVQKYDNKYLMLKRDDSTPIMHKYDDGKTFCSVSKSYYEGMHIVGLSYIDKNLLEKYEQAEQDEI